MTDKLREAIEALPRYDMDQSGESSWMGRSLDGDYLRRDEVLAALAAAPQPVPDREACRAKQAEPDRGFDETPYDRGYVWGYRHGLRDGKAEVAPQPVAADREALVEVIREARIAWANDGDGESCPDAAIADALLARGLRLPAPETMAWAVVGEDGKVVPASCGFDKEYVAGRVAHPWDRIVRVAIRVVEGGDDAA